jgi:hypothetical protein
LVGKTLIPSILNTSLIPSPFGENASGIAKSHDNGSK